MTEPDWKRRAKELERAIRKHRKEVWGQAKTLKDVRCEDDRKLYEVLDDKR
jgi:hypothetical protein